MSKKKVASRSAMTLKDFHGGSIPSDLPLPSAPGMSVDRSVYERQGSGTWMSPTPGRGYGIDRISFHRGSSNGARTFEDKSSYFPNPANIGRNYDEDERKPVDGRPRSSHSADRFDDGAYEERRGLYAVDRYALDDRGSFGGVYSFSEPRGSTIADRFPPSQVAGSRFESDIFVHDEFGLIPVGPPPSRVAPLESQPWQQPLSYPGEHSESRPEQLSYAPFQQSPSVPTQQVANSPPRPWKTPSHQVQSTASTPHVQSESGTNFWTSRRDVYNNRLLSSEGVSQETAGYSPWRPHGVAGRGLDTRALDKVSSGRWQSDASRLPGVHHEKRTPLGAPIFESTQPWYASESVHSLPKPDSGRSMQSPNVNQSGSDERSSSKMMVPRGGKDVLRGDGPDRSGSADVQGGGFGAYGADTGRRSYSEEVWSSSGGFTESVKFGGNRDLDRADHSDTGDEGFKDFGQTSNDPVLVSSMENMRSLSVDDGRAELIDQTRSGFRDSSKVGPGSSNGRFSHFEPAQSVYSERTRNGEAGEVSPDTGHVRYQENGRSLSEDGNVISFGPEKQSRDFSTLERTGGESYDKARISAPEGWRTGSSSHSLNAPIESSWLSPSEEQSELAERPKLKLLPRSKPLQKIELSNPESEDRSGHEDGSINYHRQLDEKKLPEVSLDGIVLKRSLVKELGSSNEETDEESNRRAERPKLNLKPRSQPAEAESEEGSQKVRLLVFGGARPRELVLKERGGDVPFSGSLDTVQTPLAASIVSVGSTEAKWEQADIRNEKAESRGDEKLDTQRYERQDKSFERQGSHRMDKQENGLVNIVPEYKWDLDKERQWDLERLDGRIKRELERPDDRRDIDKQETWRRPSESLAVNISVSRNSSSAVSSLVDPPPRVAGKYGYSPTASAVELAQAFSRISGIGSPMVNAAHVARNRRSPVNPISKSSFQGPGNGISGQHTSRDAPFSRLAEASALQLGVGGMEMHVQGGLVGVDSQTNSYGNVKLGTFGSGDLKRASLSARSDLATGRELNEQNDDFPGKRGLPLRQKEGYFE